jgi:hypothetical protein
MVLIEIQLINVERMVETENHLANTIAIMDAKTAKGTQ